MTFEDLGTKEIEGITAHGYRTTQREVNASGDVRGRPGIDEVWVSDDFAAKLLGIRNSLEGKVTSRTSLIEISLAEPDATLFEIPSDYKVNSRGEPLRVQTGKKQ